MLQQQCFEQIEMSEPDRKPSPREAPFSTQEGLFTCQPSGMRETQIASSDRNSGGEGGGGGSAVCLYNPGRIKLQGVLLDFYVNNVHQQHGRQMGCGFSPPEMRSFAAPAGLNTTWEETSHVCSMLSSCPLSHSTLSNMYTHFFLAFAHTGVQTDRMCAFMFSSVHLKRQQRRALSPSTYFIAGHDSLHVCKNIFAERIFLIAFLIASIRTDAHSHELSPGSLSLSLHHNLCLIKSHHSYFPHDVAICHCSFTWLLCKCPKSSFCLFPYCTVISLQEKRADGSHEALLRIVIIANILIPG